MRMKKSFHTITNFLIYFSNDHVNNLLEYLKINDIENIGNKIVKEYAQ